MTNTLLVRKPASEEERSSGPPSLLDPSAEAELEAKLARERRRLADIEKELKLEILNWRPGWPWND
jgi:hypothetical protein